MKINTRLDFIDYRRGQMPDPSSSAGAPTPLRYEDAAVARNAPGWACKSCGLFWASECDSRAEHNARMCCATDYPCACGARIHHRFGGKCDACRKVAEDAKWTERERRPWDGSAALYSETLDRYFFDEEDVQDAIRNADGGADSLRLLICEKVFAQEVDEDYFADALPEDLSLDDCAPDIAEALGILNAVIASHRKADKHVTWIYGKYAAALDSLPTPSAPEAL